ncbi:MAG: hypothetical protein QOF24_2082 [Verrucomicrobiota bacterium]|jgi:hypothetical protein
MKKLLTLTTTVLLALAATSFAASDKDTVIQAEKNVWQAIKDKKFDAFQKMLSADFRAVYASAINKLDQEVVDIKKVDMKSVTFGDMDVVFIDKDAALLTYTVTVEGTEDGKNVSGKWNAASVWKKDGNDWKGAFHTEMKAE